MPIEIYSKDDKNHRINHPVYNDVYNVTYESAVITDFETEDTPKGMALTGCVRVEDGDDKWIPVFYHCKRHCYRDETGDLRANEALIDGVNAFQIGDEVILMKEKGSLFAVVGHIQTEDHIPKMCADHFKMTFISFFNPKPYFIYYQGTTQEEAADLSVPPTDYYGNTPVCDQEGIILFGKQEFWRGSLMYYWGDHLVKVGPVFYIIRIESVGGLPAPLTGPFVIFKAVWSEDLVNQCISRGAACEGTLPGAPMSPFPTWPEYPDKVVRVPTFAVAFDDRFSMGWSKGPPPRWVHTRFYGQSYYEE